MTASDCGRNDIEHALSRSVCMPASRVVSTEKISCGKPDWAADRGCASLIPARDILSIVSTKPWYNTMKRNRQPVQEHIASWCSPPETREFVRWLRAAESWPNFTAFL